MTSWPEFACARRTTGAAAVVVALLAALPFMRGMLQGRSFYFRDLALHFFPLRLFALEGLRRGQLRYWNPFLHEGVPSAFPPVSYPLDLLALAWPSEAGLSLLLALHVPLCALSFLVLARSRGVPARAAAGASLAYALGGFCLSSLNLYVYVEAMAWAPLVIWALDRAALGGRRDVAVAGILVAVSLSTLGFEVVAQTIVVGLALAARPALPALARMAAAVALGAGLAAPTLLPMGALVAASQRGIGFPTEVVLAQSVHPLTLVQVVVAGWYGDASDLANRWWGSNFFPRGFPYVLSLYLGAALLSVTAVGAGRVTPGRRRIVLLGLAAAIVSLGHWAGLGPLVEAVAALRAFRYPAKAFFTVHLSVALLAAHGLAVLESGERRAWRVMAAAALASGALLVSLGALTRLAPGATQWFLAGFMPPEFSWPQRQEALRRMVADAALGGLVALAVGGLGLLALGHKLAASRAALGVSALVAADLLRAGTGLNPQVPPSFFRPSPELAAALPFLRASGRVYTCAPHDSPAYWRAREARPGAHELWTFAVYLETLTPESNVPLQVPTAYSEDYTSLVPPERVPRGGRRCVEFETLASRLRQAAVTHVVSLDSLESPALVPVAAWQPRRLAPLTVHVYALRDPLPLWTVVSRPDRADGTSAASASGEARGHVISSARTGDALDLLVEAAAPAFLVLREADFPGWTARVEAASAPVLHLPGSYRAVPVPAGRSQVALRYHPPGLRAGLLLFLASAAVALVLGRPRAVPGDARS